MAEARVEQSGDGPGFVDAILAATAQHQSPPPWMRFSEDALDEAKLLYGGKWGDDNESLVTLIGPTSRTMECLRSAMGNRKANDKNETLAHVRIMTECVYSLPESMIARRTFEFDDKVIIEKGEKLVAPDDLEIPDDMKGKRKAIAETYVMEVLPNKLWGMVLQAVWIMATPDLLEMMERLQKKEDEKEKKGEKSDDGPNSPEDSSGSSEET